MSKRYPVMVAVLIAAGSIVSWPDFCSGSDLKIYGIDVEQGDAALVVFPDGGTMIIDAGRSWYGPRISALLQRLGLGTPPIRVLSHDHADHYGGFPSVGGYNYDRHNVNAGDILYSGGGATCTSVCVNGNIIGGGYKSPGSNENSHSLVLLISYGGFDYLTGGDLTGQGSYPDVESALGDALVSMGVEIDVYEVHHHGSRHSSGLSFLQDIMPENALIFVGSNGYGHPTQEILNRLNSIGVTGIYQTNAGSGGWAPNITAANGQIVITTDGSTYSITNEGQGSTPFSHGPYQVDEYVGPPGTPTSTPTVTPTPTSMTEPPHLMISEVAVGDHTPEGHDWIELYLPPGALSVDLSTLFWTDFDRYGLLADNGSLTLSLGDVVIVHDASGTDESDVTGKGENGVWDVYLTASWSLSEDQFVITSEGSTWPAPGAIIDAVTWSNDSGWMSSSEVSEGNYLITSYHWGDPVAGSGEFETNNEGPAIGDINYGFAGRIDTEDTNSVSDWTVDTSHSYGIPPEIAPLLISFQPASSQAPEGYFTDDDSEFGTFGGYGWQ